MSWLAKYFALQPYLYAVVVTITIVVLGWSCARRMRAGLLLVVLGNVVGGICIVAAEWLRHAGALDSLIGLELLLNALGYVWIVRWRLAAARP